MRLLWVGGPTARIELGSFRLLTDPMLSQGPAAFIMNGHPSTGEDNVPIARLASLPPVIVAVLGCAGRAGCSAWVEARSPLRERRCGRSAAWRL
jgi:hypothetical protein